MAGGESSFACRFDAGNSRSVAEGVAQRLEKSLEDANLTAVVRRDVTVPVPAFRREVTVPYRFQNGRFNLIRPASFVSANAIYRACHFAVAGRSLYEHLAQDLGLLQLMVVGQFEATEQEIQIVVKEILTENQVSLFTVGELPRLLDEIRAGRSSHATTKSTRTTKEVTEHAQPSEADAG